MLIQLRLQSLGEAMMGERRIDQAALFYQFLAGRIHITDWTTNPNFLDAYSAVLPGFTP